MSEAPLFGPRDFAIGDGITHVCAGGETAALRRHDAALSRYLRDKSNGMAGRTAQEAEIDRARAGIARGLLVAHGIFPKRAGEIGPHEARRDRIGAHVFRSPFHRQVPHHRDIGCLGYPVKTKRRAADQSADG